MVIPLDLSSELRATLFNLRETRPASHIYVLLDRNCPVAPDHPLHPERLDARTISRERAAVAPAPAEGGNDDDQRPMLLQLYRAGENGYVDEELLDLSLDTAVAQCTSINGCYVAAWIASDLDPKALAVRLSKNCELFDPTQARTRHLPLHEPHRMALLQGEPDAKPFLKHFLESIQLWSFIDAAGSLRSLKRLDTDIDDEVGARRLSLKLARAQANLPVARLALLGLVKASLPIPLHVEQQIEQALQSASRLGLTHDEDVVFFVLNTFSLSPLWHEHPEAKRCIDLSHAEEAPLAGLMAALSDEVLDEIAQFRIAQ